MSSDEEIDQLDEVDDTTKNLQRCLGELSTALEELKAANLEKQYTCENAFNILYQLNDSLNDCLSLPAASLARCKKMLDKRILEGDSMDILLTALCNMTNQLFFSNQLTQGTEEYDQFLSNFSPFFYVVYYATYQSKPTLKMGEFDILWETLHNLLAGFCSEEMSSDLKNLAKEESFELWSLQMAYNLVRFQHFNNLNKARCFHMLERMAPYTSNSEPDLRIYAILFNVYVSSEEEIREMFKDNSDKEDLHFIVENLEDAMKNENKRSKMTCMNSIELLQAVERLAKNETNAKLLLDMNILQMLDNILNEGNMNEKLLGVKCIWSLCLHKTIADSVAQQFFEKMESWEQNCPITGKAKEEQELKKAIQGVMFTMNQLRNPASNAVEKHLSDGEYEIMISYQHGNLEVVLNLLNKLKAANYKVWIDKEHMEGNIFTAMANAVSNAKVVLLCISKQYEMSQNCQLEAQFTHNKQKPSIPVVVQAHYKPDGWLGLILGSQLYYDFSGRRDINETFQSLKAAINKKIGIEQELMKPETSQPLTSEPRPYGFAKYTKLINLSEEQMAEWYKKHNIASYLSTKLTGKSLALLKRVERTFPEHFMKILRNDLNLREPDVLFDFISALDDLEIYCPERRK